MAIEAICGHAVILQYHPVMDEKGTLQWWCPTCDDARRVTGYMPLRGLGHLR